MSQNDQDSAKKAPKVERMAETSHIWAIFWLFGFPTSRTYTLEHVRTIYLKLTFD